MKISMLLRVAISAAFFFASPALAQNAGTVTNHAFAIGKGAGTTGYTSLLCGSAQLAVGQSAADPICRTITGDVTITAAGATAIGAGKVTATMIGSITSAELATILTNETGTAGSVVFSASPTFTGTPLAPTASPNDNSTKIATTAYVDAQVSGGVGVIAIPRAYISGFATQNNAGTPNTNFDVGVGSARDSTDTANIALASSITKTTGAWTVGTGNGCLDTGSVANATWYYLFAILRPDTGVVDVACSTSSTTVTTGGNISAAYTKWRLIGFLLTNGSAQILGYTQVNNAWYWTVNPTDINTSSSSSSITTVAMSVPRIAGVEVFGSVTSSHATTQFGTRIFPAFLTTATDGWLYIWPTAAGGSALMTVGTNSSGQVKYNSSISSVTIQFVTAGFRVNL